MCGGVGGVGGECVRACVRARACACMHVPACMCVCVYIYICSVQGTSAHAMDTESKTVTSLQKCALFKTVQSARTEITFCT